MDAVNSSPRGPWSAQLSALGMDTVAGTLGAVLALSCAIGYGAMIFSAGLSPWLTTGVPTALVSCVVVALLVALTSSVPFMIGGPASNAAALLAGVASGVAMDVKSGGSSGVAALANEQIRAAH